MHTDLLTKAATKQTWRDRTDVRQIIARIIEKNPRGSDVTWRRAFYDELRADDDSFEAAADYAFDGALRAWHTLKEREKNESVSRTIVRERLEKERQQDKAIAKQAADFIKEKILLLNQEMPNGKRLRYCTLDYLYRLGGAYRNIGRKGDQSTVGSKYNEIEFRAKFGAGLAD